MSIFSRKLWGNVLIIAGIILFIVVAYDAFIPLFPAGHRGGVLSWIEGIFSSKPAGQTGRGNNPGRPEAKPPPPLPSEAARKGLLTLNVHNTNNNYHLWAWRLKPEKKTGNHVKVEIAHAVPGPEGGFQIVAFADRNGDNKPDREIARSDFLTSEEAGQFSALEFDTADEVIFLGATWPGGEKTRVYRGSSGWPGPDPDFDDRFFHVINGFETQSAGPAYTNMKVSFSD